MTIENFLRDSWQDSANRENGEEVDDQPVVAKAAETRDPRFDDPEYQDHIKGYKLMKERNAKLPSKLTADQKELLHSLFEDVQDCILGYVNSINDYKEAQIRLRDLGDPSGFETTDESRRYAHNALIGSLNILERNQKKYGPI